MYTFFQKHHSKNIEAVNNKAAGVIDFETGNFAFRIQIQDFIFEKSLMQEHFNENYMESGKAFQFLPFYRSYL